ncbi:hypothetical protein LINGRAHAP2_LOCUS15252 [Linum grandiflorum]
MFGEASGLLDQSLKKAIDGKYGTGNTYLSGQLLG